MTTDTGRLTTEQDTALHTLQEELRALAVDELITRCVQLHRDIRGKETEDELNTFERAQLNAANEIFIHSALEHNPSWDEAEAEDYLSELLFLGEVKPD